MEIETLLTILTPVYIMLADTIRRLSRIEKHLGACEFCSADETTQRAWQRILQKQEREQR